MIVLGLTGGIGSGKSTVAGMLHALGAPILDADAISRQATAAGGAAIEGIRRVFGDDFINSTGAMDRPRMRQLSFSDTSARRQLEAIVHPVVQQEFAARLKEYAHQGAWLVVCDVPLLVESGHWRTWLDRILVIDCTTETQTSRVLARSAAQGEPMNRDAVCSIIATQSSREQRLACADFVICNENIPQAELSRQVSELWRCLLLHRDATQSKLSSVL